MHEAAQRLVGEHDFNAFAAAGHGRLSTVRTIFTCAVTEPTPGRVRIEASLQRAGLRLAELVPFNVPERPVDFVLYCGKHRPELYFDAKVRGNIFAFTALDLAQEIGEGARRRVGAFLDGAGAALRERVPIVPVVSVGAHQSLFIATDGRFIAEALGLPSRFRSNVWPIGFALPYGLVFGLPAPHFPPPVKIHTRILKPIRLDLPPQAADDPDLAREGSILAGILLIMTFVAATAFVIFAFMRGAVSQVGHKEAIVRPKASSKLDYEAELAVIVGSLRRESLNRQLVNAVIRLLPSNFAASQVPIGDLPPYNQDDDDKPGEAVQRLKQSISLAHGVLFATPEYNRSIPGVLKNAIDHASRPYGKSAWAGKPAGVIGISVGAAGSSMAQQHLRNVLAYLDMPTLGQPEVFMQAQPGLFERSGDVQESSRAFLQGWTDRYVAWVTKHAA